jgi:thymidylate kinase
MIILITGPDRCGKDTLVREIRQRFNSVVFHQLHYLPIPKMSLSEQKAYEETMNNEYFQMINFYSENNINVIFNRCHIDSLVYAPIYRGYSNEYILGYEKKIKSKDIFLITLIDEAKKIAHREDGQSQNKGDFGKIQQELNFHKKYNEASFIKKKLIVDMANKNFQSGINEAIEFIEYHLK